MTAAIDLRHARYTITMHAIRRYQERIDTTASDAAARDAILRALERAYVERVLDERTVQLRARGRRFPGRIRIRVRPCSGHLLQVVTVLPQHDGAQPRRPHPKGACNGRPASRYEPGDRVGGWEVVRYVGKLDANGAHVYEARCVRLVDGEECGTVKLKTTAHLRSAKNGCRSCSLRDVRAETKARRGR